MTIRETLETKVQEELHRHSQLLCEDNDKLRHGYFYHLGALDAYELILWKLDDPYNEKPFDKKAKDQEQLEFRQRRECKYRPDIMPDLIFGFILVDIRRHVYFLKKRLIKFIETIKK